MNNLTVRGITIRDSPMFHIVSQGGSHKRFSNLSLLSGCGFATALLAAAGGGTSSPRTT